MRRGFSLVEYDGILISVLNGEMERIERSVYFV